MGKQLGFDYYYGIEAEQFSFYRVPRILIKDKRFENLSSDAKLLYGLMLDRMSLSMKNGWLDAENKVYIYYTVEEVMKDLSCARATVAKIIAELDSKKGIGLIEKKRQGLGRPDIIYVKNFATVGQEKEKTDQSEEDVPKDSSGGKTDKSDGDVPKASSYGKTDKSDVGVPKESSCVKADKSDRDVPKASSYEKTEEFHADVLKEVETVEEKKLERNRTERMEFEFPEVQNLDFREWEAYDVPKGRNNTENDDIPEYFTELGVQEDVTLDFPKFAYGTDVTYRTDKEALRIQEEAGSTDSGYVSCVRTRTQSQDDDAFSEEELAYLCQLNIENPQQIAKESICVYEKAETTACAYPYPDMPYENAETNDSEIESSVMQNWGFYEGMEENANGFDVGVSEVQELDFQTLQNDTFRSSEIELQEVQNLDFKKFKHHTSGSSEIELADIQSLDPNYTNTSYTNHSYTDVSYNNPIYPIHPSDKNTDGYDGCENSSAYISVIKENLDYDTLMQDRKWADRELYEELFQLICEVVCVKRKSVRVAGEDYPYELVKSKFLKLNSSHLTYVMDCMHKTVSKIGNIKAYMITALYNATNTMNHYYRQAVQHDIYGGGWKEAGLV